MGMDEDGNLERKASYIGVEYKDLPCSNCKLVHGASVMDDVDAQNNYMIKSSIDGMTGDNGTDFDDASFTLWGTERADVEDLELLDRLTAKEVCGFFCDFIRFFIRMDANTQRVVCHWLTGKPLRQAAADIGMTPQGAHRLLQVAHKRFYHLRSVKTVFRKS